MTHTCADCGASMPGPGIIKASTPQLGIYYEGPEICDKCMRLRKKEAEK